MSDQLAFFVILGILILMGSVGYMLYSEHVATFGCMSYHNCK